VVGGPFGPDEAWNIHITRSAPLGAEDIFNNFSVENARVWITNDQGYSEELVSADGVDAGYHFSAAETLPDAGVEYRLRVEHPTLPYVEAVSMAPEVEFEIIDHVQIAEGYRRKTIAIPYTPGRDFYRLNVCCGAVTFDNQHLRLYIDQVGDPEAELGNEDFILQPVFFSDVFFEGGTAEIAFDYREGRAGYDVESLELMKMSEDLFAYERSLLLHDSNFSANLQRPTPVYSNIQDGLGIFAGYGLKVIEVGDP